MSDIYEGLNTEKLAEIDEELESLIDQLRQKPATSTVESEALRLGNLASVLTNYLAHQAQFMFVNLQKDVAKQTEMLVKWNRTLAISTTALAGATFALVIVTFVRGVLI
jgi:hypothetical protein